MAKVKLSTSGMDAIESHIDRAISLTEEASTIWGENFDNLYWDFKESGFLDDLYKDAESQYYHFANLGFIVSYTAAGFGTGAGVGAVAGSIVPGLGNIAIGTIGGIIGAIIGFFTGIYHCIKNPNSVKWSYVSQQVFVDLLYLCSIGREDNYIYLYDTLGKIESVKASMIEVRNKVNEFQQEYANLQSLAESFGLQTTLAQDGVTMLSVDTEVTIGDEKISLSVSEAMNAFFTYDQTLMAAELEADYMERTYGSKINYMELVNNANGFMAKTVKSNLYSHEFVSTLLPSYTVDVNAKNVVSEGLGVNATTFESMLGSVSGLGNLGAAAGLVGAGFLGTIVPKGNSGGGKGSSSKTTSTPEIEKEEEKVELPVIEEIISGEIPSEVISVIEVDYDDLARAEYESQSEEELNEHVNQVIEESLSLYENEEFEIIKKRLEEFGYSEPEIESILKSQEYVTMAFVEGDQRQSLASIANRLADQDGIKNYDTSYDDGQEYRDLVDGTNATILVNMSQDKSVVDTRNVFREAEKQYKESITLANNQIKVLNEAKNALDEIQKKLGSDQTHWSLADAESYNKTVKEYNEAMRAANELVSKSNDAKTNYVTSKEKYEMAKKNFLDKIKENKLNEVKPDDSVESSSVDNNVSSNLSLSDEEALNFVITNENEN